MPRFEDLLEQHAGILTHLLAAIGRRENRTSLRLTAAALEKVIGYTWPGNVRELVNLIERAVLLAPDNSIDAEHIIFSSATTPEPSAMPIAYREAKQKFEIEYYTQLLRMSGGNVSLAANLGQKTRKEIYDALEKLELDVTSYRIDD